MYAEFSEDYREWLKAVKLLAELDCLVSLAKSSAAIGYPAVRPDIIDEEQASVHFEELRHPCVFSASSEFIPNSVSLGRPSKNMVLLTGPNVGQVAQKTLSRDHADALLFILIDGRKIYTVENDLRGRYHGTDRLLRSSEKCTHIPL